MLGARVDVNVNSGGRCRIDDTLIRIGQEYLPSTRRKGENASCASLDIPLLLWYQFVIIINFPQSGYQSAYYPFGLAAGALASDFPHPRMPQNEGENGHLNPPVP